MKNILAGVHFYGAYTFGFALSKTSFQAHYLSLFLFKKKRKNKVPIQVLLSPSKITHVKHKVTSNKYKYN